MSLQHASVATFAEEGAPPSEAVEVEAEPTRGGAFLVSDVMTPLVYSCSLGDTLDRPARLMWEHDCGAIPVLDERQHTVGMITDRDICMAAYIQGRPLAHIAVASAASKHVYSVLPGAPLSEAHHLMKMHRVRRLPVVDIGGNLVGMLSLADVLRHSGGSLDLHHPLHVENVLTTLADAFRPGASRRPEDRG